MSPRARRRLARRALGGAQLAGGVALLRDPQAAAQLAAGPRDPAPPVWVVKLLAGRLLVQGAASAAVPTRLMARLSLAVDLLHSASMLGLAAAVPRYRHVGAVAAVPAGATAVPGAWCAGGPA